MSLAALAACMLALANVAAVGSPVELDATIVWSAADHFYFATRDTSKIEPGMTLSVVSKGRVVATAVVDGLYDGELARARITSGSLARERKLDRLRILAERSPSATWPLLRVGYPSIARHGLLFTCDSMSARSAPPAAYHKDASDPGGERWVRLAAVQGTAWPDTVVVRWFDDAADEEIAIERGDIDAGVFWPGELSPRMRADERWSWRYGRTSGVLAISGPPSAIAEAIRPRDTTPWDRLNRRLFLGDLIDVRGGGAPSETTFQPVAPSDPPASEAVLRIVVDSSLPGAAIIQRWLDQTGLAPASGAVDTVRLVFVKPVDARSDARQASDHRKRLPLFGARCPVVWSPRVDTPVRMLGADALVDWMQCAHTPPEGSTP